MSEAPLLFLDANALVSPVTRTLLIAGARADGLRWTWSRHVEVEADRHARGQASRTSIVRRRILGTELSPTAQDTDGLATPLAPTTRHRSRLTQTSRARFSGAWPAFAARRALMTRTADSTDCVRST